jgi:hypothetical protein
MLLPSATQLLRLLCARTMGPDGVSVPSACPMKTHCVLTQPCKRRVADWLHKAQPAVNADISEATVPSEPPRNASNSLCASTTHKTLKGANLCAHACSRSSRLATVG